MLVNNASVAQRNNPPARNREVKSSMPARFLRWWALHEDTLWQLSLLESSVCE